MASDPDTDASAAPQISVTLSPDNMRATLSVVREAASTVAKDQVLSALEDAGVKSGINKEALAEVLQRTANETVVEAIIAEGELPQDGTDGSVTWKVGEPSLERIVRVKKGAVVAIVTEPTRGKPGSNVTGQELPAKSGSEIRLMKGRGVSFDRNRGEWKAESDGSLVFKDGRVSVEEYQDASFTIDVDESGLAARISIVPSKGRGVPVEKEIVESAIKESGILRFDDDKLSEIIARAAGGTAINGEVFAHQDEPEIETSISADAMEATVKLKLSPAPIRQSTPELVRPMLERALTSANITDGIDSDALDRLVAEAIEKGKSEGVAARGTKAENGADGSLEWIVQDPTGENPIVAKAGNALARLIPATSGSPAKTVTGLTIKAKPGRELRIVKGAAVSFDRKNSHWLAEKEGRVVYKAERLSIEPFENASFTVEIDDDGTKATLSIVPAKKHGKLINIDQIKKEIARQEFLHFDEKRIAELVAKAGEGTAVTKEVIAESDPPMVQTRISASAMEAEMEVQIPSKPIRRFSVEQIEQLLSEGLAGAKISFGIDQKARDKIVADAANKGKGAAIIARGTLPDDGADGKIEWLDGNPEEALVLVDAETGVAKALPPTAGTNGSTVTGVELKARTGQEARLVKGKGIVFDKKSGIWSASEKGSLFYNAGSISIKPYADAGFTIDIDPGGHIARLSITPRQGEGRNVDVDSVAAELQMQGITAFDRDVLEQAAARAATGAMVMHRVVAQSDPPAVKIAVSDDNLEATATVAFAVTPIARPSEEYLFRAILTELKQAGIVHGVEKERALNFVKAVLAGKTTSGVIATGQAPENESDELLTWKIQDPSDSPTAVTAKTVIAEVTSSTPGKPGYSVKGERLEPSRGIKSAAIAGKGVSFDAKKRQWIATENGAVNFDGKMISVAAETA